MKVTAHSILIVLVVLSGILGCSVKEERDVCPCRLFLDLTSVDMQNEFGTCKCKVRLITFDEARKYNDLIDDKDLTDWWWTCTPWSTEERGWSRSLAVVSSSGFFNDYFCYYGNCVRPFCILKSNIFVSKGE